MFLLTTHLSVQWKFNTVEIDFLALVIKYVQVYKKSGTKKEKKTCYISVCQYEQFVCYFPFDHVNFFTCNISQRQFNVFFLFFFFVSLFFLGYYLIFRNYFQIFLFNFIFARVYNFYKLCFFVCRGITFVGISHYGINLKTFLAFYLLSFSQCQYFSLN